MQILVDLDNTLFDFSPHFEAWARQQGHEFTPGVLGQTYSFEAMFGKTLDWDAFLDPFFECEETMRTFPPLPGSVEAVRRLNDAGYSFVAISACTDKPGLARCRHQNLLRVFGVDFDDVVITGYGKPKADVLKNYRPSVWVEDHLDHARAGAALGHRTFVIDHPYNQGDGAFTRVRDWNSIAETLLG